MNLYDCIVIGAGPAGMTSSIYLKRAGKKVLLLEKGAPGGQIINTNNIENYPGYVNVKGSDLATNMFNQVMNLNINYKYGNVLNIKKEDNYYKVVTDMEEYITKKIIISSGRSPRKLGLEKEDKLIGRGISYCATCDGAIYKNKNVAVVGAGNTALEEALYLSKICKHVYLFNRSENIRADQLNQEEIKKTGNIDFINNSIITELIEKDNILTGIKVNNNDIYEVSCLFIFIGQIPSVIKIDNIKEENNYIIVNNNMATNLKGIYACGDVIKKDNYQISIAVGEATVAALNVIKELNNE